MHFVAVIVSLLQMIVDIWLKSERKISTFFYLHRADIQALSMFSAAFFSI